MAGLSPSNMTLVEKHLEILHFIKLYYIQTDNYNLRNT